MRIDLTKYFDQNPVVVNVSDADELVGAQALKSATQAFESCTRDYLNRFRAAMNRLKQFAGVEDVDTFDVEPSASSLSLEISDDVVKFSVLERPELADLVNLVPYFEAFVDIIVRYVEAEKEKINRLEQSKIAKSGELDNFAAVPVQHHDADHRASVERVKKQISKFDTQLSSALLSLTTLEEKLKELLGSGAATPGVFLMSLKSLITTLKGKQLTGQDVKALGKFLNGKNGIEPIVLIIDVQRQVEEVIGDVENLIPANAAPRYVRAKIGVLVVVALAGGLWLAVRGGDDASAKKEIATPNSTEDRSRFWIERWMTQLGVQTEQDLRDHVFTENKKGLIAIINDPNMHIKVGDRCPMVPPMDLQGRAIIDSTAVFIQNTVVGYEEEFVEEANITLPDGSSFIRRTFIVTLTVQVSCQLMPKWNHKMSIEVPVQRDSINRESGLN